VRQVAAIARPSLGHQAYEAIHAAIAAGGLQPGEPLTEEELAAFAGMSRTPVRTALRRLELEGYVERDDAGRLTVHRLTRRELEEVFFVRELLESYAARLAAERISDEELRRLRELLDADLKAVRKRQISALAVLNDELHAIILRASRNRTLQELVGTLRSRARGLSAFAVGDAPTRRAFVDQHIQLVRLLEDGDAEAASETTVQHLRMARDILLEGLPDDG
jgi:DNA-binding GntR family transcriptional regulator